MEGLNIALLAAAYAAWAGGLIWRSSFVAIDGKRYFSLFDDAMISMRYAWNLAHGDGLVWNSGERVEGITNLLMTLLMALPAAVFDKIGAVLAVQVAGVAFVLVTAYLAMRVADAIAADAGLQVPARAAVRVLAFASVLAYYPLSYWSVMGMETGLLSALVCGALVLALRDGRSPRPGHAMAALLGLAYLTRPDSLIAAALIVGYRLVALYLAREPPARPWAIMRAVLIEAGIVALFVVAVTAFRYGYYGEWVPNTYYLKIDGIPLEVRIDNGLIFTAKLLPHVAVALAVCVLGLAVNRQLGCWLLLATFTAFLAYQVYVGGDVWTYWRMTAPYAPALIALCVVQAAGLIAALAHRLGRAAPPRRIAAAALAVVMAATLAVADRRFVAEMTLSVPPYLSADSRRNVNAAVILNQLLRPGATMGVFAGGTMPYYAGFYAIDMLGKNDKYIARLPPDLSGAIAAHGMSTLPGHNKYDLEFSIVRLRPTYIQGYKWGRQNLEGYVKRAYMGMSAGEGTENELMVLLRRGSKYWKVPSRR